MKYFLLFFLFFIFNNNLYSKNLPSWKLHDIQTDKLSKDLIDGTSCRYMVITYAPKMNNRMCSYKILNKLFFSISHIGSKKPSHIHIDKMTSDFSISYFMGNNCLVVSLKDKNPILQKNNSLVYFPVIVYVSTVTGEILINRDVCEGLKKDYK